MSRSPRRPGARGLDLANQERVEEPTAAPIGPRLAEPTAASIDPRLELAAPLL